jgi:hypothetical protein
MPGPITSHLGAASRPGAMRGELRGVLGCLLLALLGVLAALTVACHVEHEVTWVNNTPYKLSIRDSKDRSVTTLEPFETLTLGDAKFLWTDQTFAFSEDGRLISRIDLTWEQLKAQGYRIVIEEQSVPPPSATATPQAPPVGQ